MEYSYAIRRLFDNGVKMHFFFTFKFISQYSLLSAGYVYLLNFRRNADSFRHMDQNNFFKEILRKVPFP